MAPNRSKSETMSARRRGAEGSLANGGAGDRNPPVH